MPENMSYADARNLIEGHLNKDKGDDDQWFWVKDLFDNTVVYEDDGTLFQATYTIQDGMVTLGTPERVKTTYEKFAELKGVEVLRTGTFISANGHSVPFTEADLDQILANFSDLPDNKIPLVSSHEEGEIGALINALTFGAPVAAYMTSLEKVIKDGVPRLVAGFGELAEKAVEMIGNQLVRLSAEIHPNFKDNDGHAHGMALLRVSFVDRSSIRELDDVTGDNLVFDEGSGQETLVLFLHEGEPGKTNQGGKGKMDEQIKKLQEAMGTLEGKFADQGVEVAELRKENEGLKKDKDGALTKLTEAATAAHKQGIAEFMAPLSEAGKVSPAMAPKLQLFMEALPHGEESATIKLGEPGKEKDFDVLGMFQEMVTGLPELVTFGEIAEEDSAAVAAGDVKELIEKFQEKNPEASYRAAADAVSKKHPELFR